MERMNINVICIALISIKHLIMQIKFMETLKFSDGKSSFWGEFLNEK